MTSYQVKMLWSNLAQWGDLSLIEWLPQPLLSLQPKALSSVKIDHLFMYHLKGIKLKEESASETHLPEVICLQGKIAIINQKLRSAMSHPPKLLLSKNNKRSLVDRIHVVALAQGISLVRWVEQRLHLVEFQTSVVLEVLLEYLAQFTIASLHHSRHLACFRSHRWCLQLQVNQKLLYHQLQHSLQKHSIMISLRNRTVALIWWCDQLLGPTYSHAS